MENNAYPELTDLNIRLQELESQGYTVFPEYLDRDTTAAIRDHIDSLVGPVVSGDHTAARRDLRHPIPGAIMARLVNNPRDHRTRCHIDRLARASHARAGFHPQRPCAAAIPSSAMAHRRGLLPRRV